KPLLEPLESVKEDERSRVDDQHRYGPLDPALVFPGIDATELVDPPFDRPKHGVEWRALAGEHALHIAAEKGRQRQDDREKDRELEDLITCHTSLRAVLWIWPLATGARLAQRGSTASLIHRPALRSRELRRDPQQDSCSPSDLFRFEHRAQQIPEKSDADAETQDVFPTHQRLLDPIRPLHVADSEIEQCER